MPKGSRQGLQPSPLPAEIPRGDRASRRLPPRPAPASPARRSRCGEALPPSYPRRPRRQVRTGPPGLRRQTLGEDLPDRCASPRAKHLHPWGAGRGWLQTAQHRAQIPRGVGVGAELGAVLGDLQEIHTQGPHSGRFLVLFLLSVHTPLPRGGNKVCSVQDLRPCRVSAERGASRARPRQCPGEPHPGAWGAVLARPRAQPARPLGGTPAH